jgi:hypothetical protein
MLETSVAFEFQRDLYVEGEGEGEGEGGDAEGECKLTETDRERGTDVRRAER